MPDTTTPKKPMNIETLTRLLLSDMKTISETIASGGDDKKVKLNESSAAAYLCEFFDNDTISLNATNKYEVTKLKGMEVTVEELNYIKGLDTNLKVLLTAFLDGGLAVHPTTFATYQALTEYDFTTLQNTLVYLCYVLDDETHDNNSTVYLCNRKTNTTYEVESETKTYKPSFAGIYSFDVPLRDFSTDPLNLATEVTNVLSAANINFDSAFFNEILSSEYNVTIPESQQAVAFSNKGAIAMYEDLTRQITDATTEMTAEETTKLYNSIKAEIFTTSDENA